MTAPSDPKAADRRLDTWKEIAAFFRCDERTVKRWEVDRGLPVHRYPGGARSKVYANTGELAAWLATAGGGDGGGGAPVAPSRTFRRGGVIAPTIGAICVLGAAAGMASWRMQPTSHQPAAAGMTKATVTAHRTHNSAAVEFYLKGLYDWNRRTPAGLTRAVDEFTQAIVRDPDYAEAYVGLANCYNLLREYTLMAPGDAYPRAKAAAERAVALDDRLAGGHSALGFVDAYWSWDNLAAEREFRRAIALDPSSAQAHHWYANFLAHVGRNAEASAEIARAQSLDPNSSAILADRALILWIAGDRTRAVDMLAQLEASDPALLSPHQYLATLYLDAGDSPRYLAELDQVAGRLNDPATMAIAKAAARGAKRGGLQAMLVAILAEQRGLYARGQLPAFALAETYARLGDRTRAMAYLEVAVRQREAGVVSLRINQAFSGLGADPAFRRLAEAAGLPAA